MRENTLQYFKRESTLPLEKSRLMSKRNSNLSKEKRHLISWAKEEIHLSSGKKCTSSMHQRDWNYRTQTSIIKSLHPRKKRCLSSVGKVGKKEAHGWRKGEMTPLYLHTLLFQLWIIYEKAPPVRLPSQIFKSVEEFSSIFSPTHPPPGQLMHPSTRPALENR